MSLISGQNLGPYEIIEQAGKGGMGEVYKAKDTRLNRIVAIKVLPKALADNQELKSRFEREAKSISSLNHPNICTLYDVGHQEGIDFLVMEYIEGATLGEYLQNKSLQLNEVLKFSIQIADALETAHRQGLVHRDLKPGNIMLTKKGVKLVDFGLARIVEDDNNILENDDVTRTTPLTKGGAILGTIQYMAPEQLEGKEIDYRADIFSFGALLYEMATGERAFSGDSQASLIASILKEEPRPLRELQEVSPRMLERTVAQCLSKEADDRWQSAGDLKRELSWILKELESPHTEDNEFATSLSSSKQMKYLFGTAIIIIVVLLLMNILDINKSENVEKKTNRFIIPTVNLKANFATPATISPDGKYIVFPADNKLWLRDVSKFDSQVLPETDEAAGVFWSTDSKYLAYSQDNRIWKYDIKSKDRTSICQIPESGRIIGGCWSQFGEIVFAVWRGGLYRVSERGGTSELIIPSDSVYIHDFHTPHFLPDGKTILVEVHAKKDEDNGYAVIPEGTTELKILDLFMLSGGVTYSPSGHLLVTKELSDPSIWAIPFSLEKLEITGEPFLVVTKGQFPTVSSDGTMVYYTSFSDQKIQLFSYSLDNKNMKEIGEPIEGLTSPVFTPDGKSIIYTAEDSDMWNLWEYNLIRGTSRRLTSKPTIETKPSFFPSGDKFIFNRIIGMMGTIEVFDLTTETITDSICEGLNPALSHDGRYLIYSTDVKGDYNLWYIDLKERSKAINLLKSDAREDEAVFSPDDKWFAYTSNQSGKQQVYIRRFPNAKNPMQVSIDGGSHPFWHPSGDTLYWVTDTALFGVGIVWNDKPELGIPQAIINKLDYKLNFSSGRMYSASAAISPDGKNIIISQRLEEDQLNRLLLVQNWFEEFKDNK